MVSGVSVCIVFMVVFGFGGKRFTDVIVHSTSPQGNPLCGTSLRINPSSEVKSRIPGAWQRTTETVRGLLVELANFTFPSMRAKLPWLILLSLLCKADFCRAQDSSGKPAIFVCGDSTAKNSGRGKNGEPVAGWGTPLAKFFDPEKVVIKNVGHAGRSSRTYYDGDWPNILPRINKGDFVLLVFGINDGSTPPGLGDETVTRNGQPMHTYGWYMAKMATDAKAKGAQVYLLTVTTRNIWNNPKVKFNAATPAGPLPDDYDAGEDRIERGTGGGRFTQWTKELGEKLHLPVFDLTNFCADKYEALGREEVNKFYSDHNHTYLPGAEFIAASIVSGLKAFNRSPFIPLLSPEGKNVTAAPAKYVSDNPGSTK